MIIDGYVNVTGRDSRPIPKKDGGYFIERIMQGAFKRAIARADEIKIMHNHKRVVGSTKENLCLTEDIIGLRAHAEITDSEIVEKAKQKRLRGWSFGFRNPTEQKSEANGMELRSISDMSLLEVSIIDNTMRPWYESTTIEARAEDEDTEVRAQEFEADYIGFVEVKTKPDNSHLKELIEKLEV